MARRIKWQMRGRHSDKESWGAWNDCSQPSDGLVAEMIRSNSRVTVTYSDGSQTEFRYV